MYTNEWPSEKYNIAWAVEYSLYKTAYNNKIALYAGFNLQQFKPAIKLAIYTKHICVWFPLFLAIESRDPDL